MSSKRGLRATAATAFACVVAFALAGCEHVDATTNDVIGATAPRSVPPHVQNWLYACDANQTCVSAKNVGIPARWMAEHVDWNEVYYRSAADTTGRNLAAAHAKHIVIYVDPNITPYCAVPRGFSASSVDFPETGENCKGQVASFLHARDGSYAHAYQHQANGNRLWAADDKLFNGAATEPLYIGDPDVRAAFAAASSQNPYATDVFEDDASGAYNCVYDYGRCDAGASFGRAHYAPPACTYTGGYWCYRFNQTAVEWDRAANPQEAYLRDAIALSNSSPHGVIGNNGAQTDRYDLEWLAAPKVKGAMVERAWQLGEDSDKFVKVANAILTYHSRGKYVVEESTDARALMLQLAAHWIVYDPVYSVEALLEVNPAPARAGADDTTFPEETVVPSAPRIATPRNNDVRAFETRTRGLFVREYAACYEAGRAIGPCAAIVNANVSPKAIAGLAFRYGHVLVRNTSATWAAGGMARWSTSVPAAIGPNDGVILAE
jgi:hypothetical protein